MINGNAVVNAIVVFLLVIITAVIWQRLKHETKRRKLINHLANGDKVKSGRAVRDWVESEASREGKYTLTKFPGWKLLARQLAKAGFYSARSLYVLIAFQGLAFLLAAVSATAITATGFSWIVAAPAFVLIALLPAIFILLRAKDRVAKMSADLPAIVDLLVQGVSGGLGLTDAMKKAIEYQPGLLSNELNRTLDEMMLGASRAQAFRRLSRRIGSLEVGRFAEAVVHVDQLGISLNLVLLSQSRAIRTRRLTDARVRAEKVSVKIMLPVILCFLPGIFIVTVAPAVFDIINTLQRP